MLWFTILISTKKWGEGKENKELWKFAGFYLPVFGPGSLAQTQGGHKGLRQEGSLVVSHFLACLSLLRSLWTLRTHEPVFMFNVSSQGPLGPAELSGRCSINVC